jgi:hypothetical protein
MKQEKSPTLSFTQEQYDQQAVESRTVKAELGEDTARFKEPMALQAVKNREYKDKLACEMKERFGVALEEQAHDNRQYWKELARSVKPLNDEAANGKDKMREGAKVHEENQAKRWKREMEEHYAEQEAKRLRKERRRELGRKFLNLVGRK